MVGTSVDGMAVVAPTAPVMGSCLMTFRVPVPLGELVITKRAWFWA